jgi:hypothetical protein
LGFTSREAIGRLPNWKISQANLLQSAEGGGQWGNGAEQIKSTINGKLKNLGDGVSPVGNR